MAWLLLVLAGCCETLGVSMINKLNKDKKWSSLLFLIVSFGLSFLFLSISMKTLPMGTAYAIWTGIGASGGAFVGMFFFGESKDWKRIVCIAIVLGSAVGLKLIS
ncbi:QacE family quaternary ammonium compound efflux SMR transporter [Paenibacillus selenitireducens]|uniref:QacE family quaternary ammonium compound efflux SMR transporter n=1 Tax=Paenibacillus selenitireducens TaxID=1324314 RepID=A0A1T2XDK0_9BACL|nr:multidrug efflux SMR transporter [Paenibacillus selenitireducens]OPA77756.1 QacE family quaternary ammonium compound efflux SMR transporter [Paenibacillus selenitireducens]